MEIEFDGEGDDVFLSSEMARRIGARKDVSVSVVVEDQTHALTRTRIAGLGNRGRISDAKVYYAVGREGGTILKVRRP